MDGWPIRLFNRLDEKADENGTFIIVENKTQNFIEKSSDEVYCDSYEGKYYFDAEVGEFEFNVVLGSVPISSGATFGIVPEDEGTSVESDQAFVNISDTNDDYTGTGGLVKVSFSENGNYVVSFLNVDFQGSDQDLKDVSGQIDCSDSN